MRYLDYLKRFTYTPNEFYDYMIAIEKAMAGDLVLVLTPATLANSAAAVNAAVGGAAEKFVRTVQVELQAADGTVHEWYTGELAAAVTETTAGDGASTIEDSATKVSLENGRGGINIEYTGTWSGGHQTGGDCYLCWYRYNCRQCKGNCYCYWYDRFT